MKQLVNHLQASVEHLKSEGTYRLLFYKGIIHPENVDIDKRDLISQALRNTPGSIDQFADIGLDIEKKLPRTDSIGSQWQDEIQPLIDTVRKYLGYFLSLFNHQTQSETNHG